MLFPAHFAINLIITHFHSSSLYIFIYPYLLIIKANANKIMSFAKSFFRNFGGYFQQIIIKTVYANNQAAYTHTGG
jgi:hypothetical protein